MHSICGPIGGFTQHIRWLLLVSNYYNSLDKLNYVGALIYQKRFPLKPDDKVKFIEQYIYPVERRLFNWLDEKYMYRQQLDKTILHTHDLSKLTTGPNIIITMDPVFSYNFYLKITPSIGEDKQDFINTVIRQNKENTEYTKNTNSYLLDTQQLYLPVLDRQIYDDMIQFLNIDNQYESAQHVHKLWYDLRKGQEEDIMDFINNSKYPDYPWIYKIGCPNTEYEHEILRQKLIEEYGE